VSRKIAAFVHPPRPNSCRRPPSAAAYDGPAAPSQSATLVSLLVAFTPNATISATTVIGRVLHARRHHRGLHRISFTTTARRARNSRQPRWRARCPPPRQSQRQPCPASALCAPSPWFLPIPKSPGTGSTARRHCHAPAPTVRTGTCPCAADPLNLSHASIMPQDTHIPGWPIRKPAAVGVSMPPPTGRKCSARNEGPALALAAISQGPPETGSG